MTSYPSGRIVLLNGSSSAGKTSLAQALQLVMPEPWQYIALDHFRDGMSPAYRGLNSPPESPGARGLNVVPIDLEIDAATGGPATGTRTERVTAVHFGDIGHRVLHAMHQSIAAFARTGLDVVVDDLMLAPEILADYLQTLQEFSVLFVGVRCPLDVVNERESTRPGRFPGTALSHFESVHAHGLYDLELDTSTNSPRELALMIKARLARGEQPTAFDRLRLQGENGGNSGARCSTHA